MAADRPALGSAPLRSARRSAGRPRCCRRLCRTARRRRAAAAARTRATKAVSVSVDTSQNAVSVASMVIAARTRARDSDCFLQRELDELNRVGEKLVLGWQRAECLDCLQRLGDEGELGEAEPQLVRLLLGSLVRRSLGSRRRRDQSQARANGLVAIG